MNHSCDSAPSRSAPADPTPLGMPVERWHWLGLFCVVSLVVHLALVRWGPPSHPPALTLPTGEIEVALAPPEPRPAAEAPPKPDPAPPTRRTPLLTPDRNPRRMPAPVLDVHPRSDRVNRVAKVDERTDPRQVNPPRIDPAERVPVRPNAEPGGIDPTKEEKPLPTGLPIGRPDAGTPKMPRMARAHLEPGGGGSPAPGPVLGGKGSAPTPEAPPEDVVFSGGGRGGVELPREAPRIGGGGGRSILSVENPLAKDAIPEEKPGLGPGLGGGQGLGAGGGVGVSRDRGIGTRLDGKSALATLRAKPGEGIGAGDGDQIGTRPPGGGKGTGAELPGTGGTGIGYGRGSGLGVGTGSGSGVGDADGGRTGRMRGIPFGDVAGILRGDSSGGGGQGGGPGGPGRGGLFGARPAPGGRGGAIHIVYVIDISRSMTEGGKLAKAKEALKKALSELKRGDTFNIIAFYGSVEILSEEMIPVNRDSLREAREYVDALEVGNSTNLSGALQVALELPGITHVFVLSDGEPTHGITSPRRLRAYVREWNVDSASITTLALGLGDEFPGMALLRGIAQDNNGSFSYVNLARIPAPAR